MSISASYAELEAALSLERFNRYLTWAAGDRERAIQLYTVNTCISESLYVPLQMLEIVLRNRIHSVMAAERGETWFYAEGALAGPQQADQLAKAIQDIKDSRKAPTPGRVVAALTFGFWTAMFGTSYENLWQMTLHGIGTKADGKGLTRKHFSRSLSPIRTLRNRIAHHEPIISWDLRKHHDNMLELIGWLSPAAQAWCRDHDRFSDVCPAQRISLAEAEQTTRSGDHEC